MLILMSCKWFGAHRRWWGGILCGAAMLLLLHITRVPDAPRLLPRLLVLIGTGLLAGMSLLYLTVKHPNHTGRWPRQRNVMLPLLLVGTVLYMSSSAVLDNWFFPTNWMSSDPFFARPWQYGVLRSLLLMLPIALLNRYAVHWRGIWPATWLALTAWIIWKLYEVTGFQMIYRTDSPSFVYRFWSFAETFPRPGFYDPHWNAGMPVPYLVASGIWSIGLFLLPFLQWFPAEQLYTPTLVMLYLGCVPGLAWLSMKWLNAGPRARWIAALLALAPTQRFWVHLLHYGTIASLFSMTMALPLAALWYRFLYLESTPRRGTLAMILACSLILFAWPGSLIIALPFALVTVLHLHRLRHLKWLWLLAGLILIGIILLPLALVPIRYSDLSAFTQTTTHQTWMEHFKNGLGLFAHNLRSTNALIVLFGFIGCFWMRRASARWFFGPLILSLLLIAGWGEEVKALLQSERIIVPAALVAILPTAWWIDRIIRLAGRAVNRRTVAAVLLQIMSAWIIAIMLTSIYQAARTWGGKGLAPFQTRPAYMDEFITWIKTEVPADGRVLFAGRAVHAYGGGKVAALPLFTGREMMSCDFYGFSPRLVEYEYPPRIFRKAGATGLAAFNDIHNVTHIVTWHDYWKAFYDTDPDRYQRVHDIGRIAIFEVQRPSSLFLLGSGTVDAHFDRFHIALADLDHPTVIKYNWADGLVADPPVDVFPFEAGYDTQLIGFDPGTNRIITIRYRR